MSCGIPVVATDVGGVYEALDENCGFLCKPKDHEEIGKCVIHLLQNEKLRKEMGVNARRKVIDNFTIGKFIKEYEEAYEKIMGNTMYQNMSESLKIHLTERKAMEAS
jgi:glycosyltransferase involved in cell wall biosynthesis